MILSVTLIGALASLPTSAGASDDQRTVLPSTTADYYFMGKCSPSLTAHCIEHFDIDLNGDGAFETPPENLGITLRAWYFSVQDPLPGISWELNVNGNQELAPTIPAGTHARVVINTGQFQPTAKLLATARIHAYSVSNESGNWLTSAEFSTIPYSFALGCESEWECARTKKRTDYGSFGQAVMFGEDETPTIQAQHNMWVATNASTIYDLTFDRDTLTWSVILVAPLTKLDGSPNEILYESFIPDTAIAYSYGTTPDLLTKYLSVTRTDFDVTREVKAKFIRVTSPVPGVLISIPDIRIFGKVIEKSGLVTSSASQFSTQPHLLIKPKVPVLSAPRSVSASLQRTSVRISGRSVGGASRYQAMCSHGAKVLMGASSGSPSSNVSGLTSGTWRCQLRAKGKIGGKWSDPILVKVRRG